MSIASCRRVPPRTSSKLSISLSAVTPCAGITRERARSVERSAPVTGGKDDPVVRVSGAAPGAEGTLGAGGTEERSEPMGAASYDETSEGRKLMVSEPVPAPGILAVSITVDVSPVRLSVIRLAPLSGLMV